MGIIFTNGVKFFGVLKAKLSKVFDWGLVTDGSIDETFDYGLITDDFGNNSDDYGDLNP